MTDRTVECTRDETGVRARLPNYRMEGFAPQQLSLRFLKVHSPHKTCRAGRWDVVLVKGLPESPRHRPSRVTTVEGFSTVTLHTPLFYADFIQLVYSVLKVPVGG